MDADGVRDGRVSKFTTEDTEDGESNQKEGVCSFSVFSVSSVSSVVKGDLDATPGEAPASDGLARGGGQELRRPVEWSVAIRLEPSQSS